MKLGASNSSEFFISSTALYFDKSFVPHLDFSSSPCSSMNWLPSTFTSLLVWFILCPSSSFFLLGLSRYKLYPQPLFLLLQLEENDLLLGWVTGTPAPAVCWIFPSLSRMFTTFSPPSYHRLPPGIKGFECSLVWHDIVRDGCNYLKHRIRLQSRLATKI